MGIFKVWSVHLCEFPILCRKVGQRQASAALLNVDSRPAQSKPGFAIPGKWSANRSYPETGLEEINYDLPEADFWGGIASGLPITREQFWGEPMKRLLVCVSR